MSSMIIRLAMRKDGSVILVETELGFHSGFFVLVANGWGLFDARRWNELGPNESLELPFNSVMSSAG